MKQFIMICCFFCLFILGIEITIADDHHPNCVGVNFDRDDFQTNESLEMQHDIVANLFKITDREVRNKIDYEYNYYGDHCGWIPEGEDEPVYDGGHAGWDVRTLKEGQVVDPLPVNIRFYSLTNGIVILDGRNGDEEDDTRGEIKYNTIAIYDEDAEKTTFYLHANAIDRSIEKGKIVKVGDPLGWQGDVGSPGAIHVHLEVQEGEVEVGDFMRASAGTKDAGTQTIDPIPYLHESIQPDIVEVLHAPIEIIDMSPAGDDLGNFIRVPRVSIDVDDIQKFFIEARSDDDIESISFVVSNHEGTRHTKNCHWFCKSISHSVRYQFHVAGQYDVIATIESKTGEIITREWLVTVQGNIGAPSLAKPRNTTVLANYPNPFNPETWIPYQLAKSSNVKVNIYNAQGVLVRVLPLGHQPAGYYTHRSRAAYWNGRNTLGEPVASGVYYYQLETDAMSSLRKMVILK